MAKIAGVLGLVVSFSVSLYSQTTNAQWVETIGGKGVEVGRSITKDDLGNTYVTGLFEDTVNFDFSSDTVSLISKGEHDIFILKLNSSGEFLWVRQFGGNDFDAGEDIKIDKDGNICVTGSFSSQIDFDPGPDTLILTPRIRDVFVLKLTPSGDLIWAKQFKSSWGPCIGREIAIDPKNDILINGSFSGKTDFDPGVGEYLVQGEQFGDVFTCKLNPSGELKWVRVFGGFSFDIGEAVTTDPLGNIYVCGHFESSFTLDSGVTFHNHQQANSFIAKLDSSGNTIWAKELRSNQINRAFTIKVDSWGDVYIGGIFESRVDFDPGFNGVYTTSKGGMDGYILKLNANGSFLWMQQLGGLSDEGLLDIEIDQNDVVHSCGYFTGPVDFDPSSSVFRLNTAAYNTSNGYIWRIDNYGNFIGAISLTGGGSSYCRSIYIDNKAADVYATGNFTTDLVGPGNTIHTSNGQSDIFLNKISQFDIGMNEVTDKVLSIAVFPNPSNGPYTLEIRDFNDVNFVITTLNGQVVYKGNVNDGVVQIDLSNLNPGVYLLSVMVKDYIVTKKLVRQ